MEPSTNKDSQGKESDQPHEPRNRRRAHDEVHNWPASPPAAPGQHLQHGFADVHQPHWGDGVGEDETQVDRDMANMRLCGIPVGDRYQRPTMAEYKAMPNYGRYDNYPWDAPNQPDQISWAQCMHTYCRFLSVCPMWGCIYQPDSYFGGVSRMLSMTTVFAGTVESFQPQIFTTALATELGIEPSTITLQTEAASVSVTITIQVSWAATAALTANVTHLFTNPVRAQAALGVAVEQFGGVREIEYKPPSPPPPSPGRPPSAPPDPPTPPKPPEFPSPLPPPSPPAPPPNEALCIAGHWPLYTNALVALDASISLFAPTVDAFYFHSNWYYMPRPYRGSQRSGDCPSFASHIPPVPPMSPPVPPSAPPLPPSVPPADACATDGTDDMCSPFDGATWSSAIASYHFYLYDETPNDGVDLRLWEWPRVTPTDGQLANNGICKRLQL